MKNVTKEMEWTHENPEIGKQTFEIAVREAETPDDAVILCGSWDRVFALLSSKMLTYVNSSKKKFDECKTLAEAQLLISGLIDQGSEVDLISTRGTGNTAKAKELDALKAIFNDPNATKEQKLAALAAQGYDLGD